mmetsp:Transcript_48764/g.54565  ORF Transcript_48764/g.54565 Transcript_48764/m.54565 type:complete len:300 (+) Transcript_48764:43-942(+)
MLCSRINLLVMIGPKVPTKLTTMTTTTTINSFRRNSMSIATTTVTGRSRKRPRSRQQNTSNTEETKPSLSSSTIRMTESSPYPEGQPWRVLWPRPHGDPTDISSSSSKHNRIPRIEDLRRAWKLYKETWEDGLTGIPKENSSTSTHSSVSTSQTQASPPSLSSSMTTPTPAEELQIVSDNAAKNLRSVRTDAAELLEQTKEKTGIRSQEDIKVLASEMMTIATECIKEFMAGYRKGRDKEIDKMLHEYFQEEEEKDVESDVESKDKRKKAATEDTINSNTMITKTRRRKRKPKRGIPRD